MKKTIKQSSIAAVMLLMVFTMTGYPVLAGDGGETGSESGFNYVVNDGGVTITKYNGTEVDVSIPAKLNNKSVTGIGYWAFGDCTSLTGVTIPNSVTSIGEWAFGSCASLVAISIPDTVTRIGEWAFTGCTSLASVTLPDGVTIIGDGAFAACPSLTSVTIPDTVTRIGDAAFAGCASLAGVTIPSSVTSIDTFAFSDCTSLTAIHVDSGNNAYSAQDGVLCNKNKTTLIRYPQGKTGNTFTILNSVTSIGEFAFDGCTSLTSVTIPSALPALGSGLLPTAPALPA